MAQTLDGVSSSASQDGAKVLSFPLQAEGNYYATAVRRNMLAAPASAWAPIVGTRTSYTQRLKYSDDFSNAAWVKAAATGTASAATDPEGGATASKLAEDNTTAAHNASQALTVAAGALAFGALVKAAERTYVRLRINNGTDGNLAIAVFSLSGDGSIVSGTGTIKKLLNGWYWCSVTGTATVTNSTAFVDLTSDGSTFSYLGTTGSGVYLWRATCYLAAAIGPAVQTTSATRAVTSPPVDDDDPLAFLCDESEPETSALELGVAKWVRSYANVPAPVVTYSTIAINKPSAGSVGTIYGTLGNYYATKVAFDAGTASGLAYSFNSYIFTPDNAVFGIEQTCTSVTSGANRRITLTSHGVTTQDILLLVASGVGPVRLTSANYTVVDPNTIDILSNNSNWTRLSIYSRAYTHGPDRVRAKKTKTFYLPGMTLGIASETDIPIPSPLINDTEFLTQVIAVTSGFLTYDANPLEFYSGPIYQQEVIAIDMADV